MASVVDGLPQTSCDSTRRQKRGGVGKSFPGRRQRQWVLLGGETRGGQHRGGTAACKLKVHRSEERSAEQEARGAGQGGGLHQAALRRHTHRSDPCARAQGCAPCDEPGHTLCQAPRAKLTNVQLIQQVAKSLLLYQSDLLPVHRPTKSFPQRREPAVKGALAHPCAREVNWVSPRSAVITVVSSPHSRGHSSPSQQLTQLRVKGSHWLHSSEPHTRIGVDSFPPYR